MHLISDDDIDFSMYEEQTDHQQRVKPASMWVQGIIDRARNPVREVKHYMPWRKTENLINFRPGEVTLWGGQNGTGKSLITGMVASSLCAQGEKVSIASFEMKPAKTLERMARQWTHHNLDDRLLLQRPRELEIALAAYEQFRDWTDGKLWMYDQQGTVHWKKVCAVARYCAQILGVKQFFVDNLMKCVKGEEDYDGQKAFIDEACSIARDENMHIHIVAHVKKPPTEDHKPTKYDIKGSGSISDQVDNVALVWRNKKKERDIEQGKNTLTNDPDTLLIIDKQRNGSGWEGGIGLWYEKQSQQFLAGPDHQKLELWNPPVRVG
jgi:twinkle protein